MTWKPRVLEQSEVDAYVDLSSLMFGLGPKASDDYRKMVGPPTEVERTFVIEDGGQLVGTAGAFTFGVALPGTTLPMAGVTEVGVRPTHRRQGMLRVLMDTVIDQAIERDEPLAGLTASEGGIYRRFGYGVAARYQTVTVDRARSQEVVDLRAPGRIRMIDEAEAEKLMPAVWEQLWPRRVGEISRPAGFWSAWAVDPEFDRDGASPRYLVVHEDEAGTADGFAVYRLKEAENPTGGWWYELQVVDLAGLDDRIEATLLRYLLDVDLVTKLTWRAAPVDLPLRWRLADSRAIDVNKERDHLWLRPLDVARCLSSRIYAADGGAVLDVVDEARPDLGGRFSLSGGPDGADCARTDAEADVVLRTPELGALLLGGVSWSTLRRAGLVDEQTDGAVDRLDAMFRPTRAPYCGTGF